jgi:predicted RNase H-like nuclease (RuvC/YqgF family)
MRIVTRREDEDRDREITFLQNLVDTQRTEILQLRAQIDDVREIPPMFMPGDREAKVTVMSDARMARIQRGEDPDAS